MTETIDLTPRWADIMPLLVDILDSSAKEESKESIKQELIRIAYAVDEQNDREKRSDFDKLHEAAQKARGKGFVVTFWTPEEVEGVENLKRLEDHIVELGNETIEDMKGHGE